VTAPEAALDVSPRGGAAPRWRQLRAQTALELRLQSRNGEQLLLTIIIPTVLLILFASAPIANLPTPRIDFLVPGVLALAVMSTSFTGLAISTGFERRYGVLRRLGTTPMSRGVLLLAKSLSVLCVEAVQVALIVAVGAAYGWSPEGDPAVVVALLILGTAAFASLGLLMAGTLRAEATLAAANLIYLLFLVLGGVAFPITDFSPALRHLLELLPITALSDGLRAVLSHGRDVPVRDWLVLAGWTLVGSVAAVSFFRWD
jgi:ABC-2 type transport system permease protein